MHIKLQVEGGVKDPSSFLTVEGDSETQTELSGPGQHTLKGGWCLIPAECKAHCRRPVRVCGDCGWCC